MSVSMAARAILYHRESEAGLIGRIYRQDPKHGLIFVAQTPVAITDHASPRADYVPALDQAEPGRYLLQLLLPSGKVMNRPFDISRGTNTTVEVHLPHEGPHEWSALQALVGQFNAPSAAPFKSIVTPAFYKDLKQHPSSGFELRFVRSDASPSTILETNTLSQIAKLVNRAASVQDVEAQLGGGNEVSRPAKEDNEYALFEFVYDGSLQDGAEAKSYYFGMGEPRPRAYLLEKSSAGATLITLPVPWTSFGNEVEVQLLLDKRGIRGGEPQYSITITDPRINSALGYVQNGAFKEAAELIDFRASQELLFHKMSSPLAAAFGGYLLVHGLDRTSYRSKAAAWRDWVDNLCNWFPWLPDGAILKAAKYFVLGDKDRDGALSALMTAYDRGLPFFTFGLNLMLEGMRRFANEGEPLAVERLCTLEALAAVTDPTHSFVNMNIARRWQAEATSNREVLAGA